MAIRRTYDLEINGKGFLLARASQLRGGRAWTRRKLPKADFRTPLADCQPGEVAGEFIINFDNVPAAGWGEGRRQQPGRYAYGRNIDARFPGQVILGPLYTATDATDLTAGAPPTQFWEFASNLYLGWGRYILQVTVSSGALTSRQDLGSGKAFLQAAPFDALVYIAAQTVSGGAAEKLWRQTAATTFGQSADSNVSFDAFAPGADSTGRVLYGTQRYSSITKMQKLASGAAGETGSNWGTGVPYGTLGRPCRWLVPYGYSCYGAFADGLYGFDESLNSVNVMADLASYADADNGVGAKQWHGALIIPTIRGLFRFDGRTVEDIGPIQGTTLRTDAGGREFGYITAIAGDSDWLYVATYNGTDSYVFAGREGYDGMVWHTLVYLASLGPFTAMHLTGLSDPPRMFLAQQAATSAVVYFDVPAADNPLQDPAYTYRVNASGAADTVLYESEHDAGVPGVSMTLDEVTVEADELSADEKLTIHYSMDHDTTWTQLRNSAGTAVTVTSSPTTLYPVADSTRVGPTLTFRVKLDRASGTTTNTPILRSIKARVTKRYPLGETRTFVVQIADDLKDRRGNFCKDLGKTLLDHLTALEDDTTPFTVVDPLGNSLNCLLVGDIQVQEAAQQDDAYPMLLASGTLRKVGA